MAFSKTLAQLASDATIGLRDVDVIERTGLSFATWRRMLRGEVPGDDKILALAHGLGLDPEPFLKAAAEVRPSADAADIIAFGLEKSGLSQAKKLQLMQLYRELKAQSEAEHNQDSAA